MALLSYVYVLAAFCVASSVQSTPHHSCSNGSALPLDLRIAGCNSLPCKLVRGSNLTAQWDFKVISPVTLLRPRVQVKVLGVTVDYPYPRLDACEDLLNGECPLEVGEVVTYALQMPIASSYPLVELNIQFSLVDELNVVQVCFDVDTVVVNKL